MLQRQKGLPILLAALGVLAAGAMTAQAANGGGVSVQLVGPRAVPPSAQYAASLYYQDDESGTPFVEEAETAPLPDEAYDSPDEAPPRPLSAADVLADELDALQGGTPAGNDVGTPGIAGDHISPGASCGPRRVVRYARPGCARCGRPRCSCSGASLPTTCGPACGLGCEPSCDASCGPTCGPSCGSCPQMCLPKFQFLSCNPFQVHGWIDQGITVNNRHPLDRFQGPVAFNDREGEYQMNQAYAYLERQTSTGGYGCDVGGRIDFLYGTDWRFTQALGLETDWNQSERFYGAALPQMYLEGAFNNLNVRIGHYYTIIGYETVPAPDNFFYSHSYTMLYGEPFTHTGVLGSYKVCDGVVLMSGFDRGWDKWEDNNNKLSYLGGFTLTGWGGRTSLSCAMTSGYEDDAGQDARNMYSVVFSHKLTNRCQYVLQHDWGLQNAGGIEVNGQAQNAYWYGINQYFIYQYTPCMSFGLRFEWFRDADGTRVGGIGAPHGWDLGPNIEANEIGWAGDFYELTLGLNWQPCRWLRVRPECRWDWYNGPVDGQGQLPYNAGLNDDQFTFGTDVIMMF